MYICFTIIHTRSCTYIVLHTFHSTANTLCTCSLRDDVIDNLFSVPRPHTDSGVCHWSYGKSHTGQEEKSVGECVGWESCCRDLQQPFK